jgi:hypothetical protein
MTDPSVWHSHLDAEARQQAEAEAKRQTELKLRAEAAASEAAEARSRTYTSRSDALKKVSIDSLTWHREAFGMMMTASFVIRNDNAFAVKDPNIRCEHSARSDTIMDSNNRTIYVRIPAHDFVSVGDFSMGFIHSQVLITVCRVTNLAPG